MTPVLTNDKLRSNVGQWTSNIELGILIAGEGLEPDGAAEPAMPIGVACRAVVPRLRDEGGRHLSIVLRGASISASKRRTPNIE